MAGNSTRQISARSIIGLKTVKNYIAQSTFEDNTQLTPTGWQVFTTTMTSGLPSGVPTVGTANGLNNPTIFTGFPLSGSNSLSISNSLNAVAGQGIISDVFTLDRAELAKVLTYSYNVESVSSNTGVNLSGILGQQTVATYLYDVTTPGWVQPSGFLGINQAGGVSNTSGNFQSSNILGQQYRLAFIFLQDTTAFPNTFRLDDISVSPQSVSTGAAMTDWVSYIPTYTGFGTVTTVTAQWRRAGDSIQLRHRFSVGTTTAVGAAISVPSAISLNQINMVQMVGSASTTSTTFPTVGVYNAGASVLGLTNNNAGTGGLSGLNGNTFTTGQTIDFTTDFMPVTGWSSNVQQSSDSDQRTVAAYLNAIEFNPTSGVTAQLQYTAALDTSGGYNPATNLYTVSVSGIYEIITKTIIYSGAVVSSPINHQLLINGTAVQTAIASDVVTASKNGSYSNFGVAANITYLAKLSAGSTIGGNVTQYSGALNTVNSTSFMAIKRLSGSAVVQNTESVNASYTLSLPQSIAATGNTAVAFDIKQYDSHAGFSVANKLYTFPVSGKFHIHGALNYTSTASGFEYGTILVLTGGYTPYQTNSKSGTLNLPCGMSYSFTVTVKAGDTVQLQTFQSSGTALNLRADNSAAALTSLYIERVGN